MFTHLVSHSTRFAKDLLVQRCATKLTILYKVVSRCIAFKRLRSPVIFVRISRGERPPRPAPDSEFPITEPTWKLITRCWAQKPNDRFSVAEAMNDLEKIYHLTAE